MKKTRDTKEFALQQCWSTTGAGESRPRLLNALQMLLQVPDGFLSCSDSNALALIQSGVTLKAWHPPTPEEQGMGHSMGQSQTGPGMHQQGPPSFMADGQVLEGQGKGQFLGPPAQRWAAASTLKDSVNR